MKVVDMHCDTISELLHARERGEEASILENHLHIDLNRMQKGDYLLQNFAMFVFSPFCMARSVHKIFTK